MRGSSHIWSVLIGVEYRNCCDVYLCFAIWIGQIQSKLLNELVTNELDGTLMSPLNELAHLTIVTTVKQASLFNRDLRVCKLQVCKLVLIKFTLSK